MSFTIEELSEQRDVYKKRMEETSHIYNQLSGAAQLLEQQIGLLKAKAQQSVDEDATYNITTDAQEVAAPEAL
jgi:hypothetical protein